jgi:hypothetical protein
MDPMPMNHNVFDPAKCLAFRKNMNYTQPRLYQKGAYAPCVRLRLVVS